MDEKETAVAEAAEEKNPKKKKRSRVPALILLLVLAALAVLAFVFRDHLTAEGLRRVFRGTESPAAQGEDFTYELGTGQVFARAGNGLAVAASSSIELMDGGGKTVFKQVVSYDTPAVFAWERGALFCDLGGTSCTLAYLDTETAPLALSPSGEILTASVNADGWSAVTTAAAGYKGLVSVYDSVGKLRYEWWSGTGYVLKAAVSPDDRLLAVLTAETGGGKLHIFRLDSETERAAAEFPGALPFDAAFMSNDRICVVGEDALIFLGTDGTETGRHDFGGAYLLDYDLDGQGFAAVCLSPYRTGSGGRVETVDRSGKLLGSAETDRNVTGLSACGRQLLAMTSGGLTLYGQDMTEQARRDGLVTAKKAILRPDGDVLLMNAYSAERIRMK